MSNSKSYVELSQMSELLIHTYTKYDINVILKSLGNEQEVKSIARRLAPAEMNKRCLVISNTVNSILDKYGSRYNNEYEEVSLLAGMIVESTVEYYVESCKLISSLMLKVFKDNPRDIVWIRDKIVALSRVVMKGNHERELY